MSRLHKTNCSTTFIHFFGHSFGPARSIFPSWDEPHQPIVVASKLHLPESSASASPTSWLPVTRHEELAADGPRQQQVSVHSYKLESHYICLCKYLNETLSAGRSVTCRLLWSSLCAAACSVHQDRVHDSPLASRGFTTTWASLSPWPEVRGVSAHYLPLGSPLAWATVTSATSVQCVATSRLVTSNLNRLKCLKPLFTHAVWPWNVQDWSLLSFMCEWKQGWVAYTLISGTVVFFCLLLWRLASISVALVPSAGPPRLFQRYHCMWEKVQDGKCSWM